MNWRIVLLAIVLTAASVPVFPAPPQTHAEALRGLQSTDATARGEAVAWLANRGTMADAPLLEARLRDESQLVRGFAEEGLWLLWSRSGNPAVDAIMARGLEAMETGQHGEAIELFTQVVKLEPAFAEGWNKRATVYFLVGEYDKSIADCDEVLKRNPHHFGAISGLGQIYERMERYEDALAWFRKALDINPNMLGVEMEIGRLDALVKQKRGRMI